MTTQAPRYLTEIPAGVHTDGARIARVSTVLGAPLMPWQRLGADLIGAHDPDVPGAWYYPLVVITVPRQAGKTTLLRAASVDRCLSRPGHVVRMTAQTGQDARKRWAEWAVTLLEGPLGSFVHVRKQSGSEAITFSNGARIAPFPPTRKAGHGETFPTCLVDEAWAFDAEAAEELQTGIRPPMLTRIDKQLIIVSTQGDEKSDWLRDLTRLGRAAVGDAGARVAYLECSADPDTDPRGDEAIDFHPAIGYANVTRESLLAERGSGISPAAWVRSYLNLDLTTTNVATLPPELADLLAQLPGLATTPPDAPLSSLSLGYAVAADRSGAAVWGARLVAGDVLELRHIASDTGAAWLPGVIRAAMSSGAPRVGADESGHTRVTTATLRTEGANIITTPTPTYATACADLVGRAKDGRLAWDGSPELLEAVRGAAWRKLGAGSAFVEGAGPIDHLRAAVVAGWLATHAPDLTTPPIGY